MTKSKCQIKSKTSMSKCFPKRSVIYFFRNLSISPCIPTSSPFCKGGLRGIFLIQPPINPGTLNFPKTYWRFWFNAPECWLKVVWELSAHQAVIHDSCNFSKSSGRYWAMRVSFLKVAKPCFISLNGGLALKLIWGQPHKRSVQVTAILSACAEVVF